jgi:hypothetical protein
MPRKPSRPFTATSNVSLDSHICVTISLSTTACDGSSGRRCSTSLRSAGRSSLPSPIRLTLAASRTLPSALASSANHLAIISLCLAGSGDTG